MACDQKVFSKSFVMPQSSYQKASRNSLSLLDFLLACNQKSLTSSSVTSFIWIHYIHLWSKGLVKSLCHLFFFFLFWTHPNSWQWRGSMNPFYLGLISSICEQRVSSKLFVTSQLSFHFKPILLLVNSFLPHILFVFFISFQSKRFGKFLCHLLILFYFELIISKRFSTSPSSSVSFLLIWTDFISLSSLNPSIHLFVLNQVDQPFFFDD